MACQASSDRGHASALFEKTSCGPEGSKSWRLAATEVPALLASALVTAHLPSARDQWSDLAVELREFMDAKLSDKLPGIVTAVLEKVATTKSLAPAERPPKDS